MCAEIKVVLRSCKAHIVETWLAGRPCVSRVGGTVISEHEAIYRLQKFAKPKNDWTSLSFRGVGQSQITWTFGVSIRRPPGPIKEPRRSVLSTLKGHFSTLAYGCCTKASQDVAYMSEVLFWVIRVDRDVI